MLHVLEVVIKGGGTNSKVTHRMHSGAGTVLWKSLWLCSQLITSPANWSVAVPGYTGANLSGDTNWYWLSKTAVKVISNSAFNAMTVLQLW